VISAQVSIAGDMGKIFRSPDSNFEEAGQSEFAQGRQIMGSGKVNRNSLCDPGIPN
jgi:hypothetical protein